MNDDTSSQVSMTSIGNTSDKKKKKPSSQHDDAPELEQALCASTEAYATDHTNKMLLDSSSSESYILPVLMNATKHQISSSHSSNNNNNNSSSPTKNKNKEQQDSSDDDDDGDVPKDQHPDIIPNSDPIDSVDISLHSQSGHMAVVLIVLAVVGFAVVGGLHWSATAGPELYAIPGVLLVMAVIFTWNTQWRTMFFDKEHHKIRFRVIAVQYAIFPYYENTEFIFEQVTAVTTQPSEFFAVAQTQIAKDAIALNYCDNNGEHQQIRLALCMPYETRRRAVGWVKYLDSIGIGAELK